MRILLFVFLIIRVLVSVCAGHSFDAPFIEPDVVVKKPVLYLYPEEQMQVNVVFESQSLIKCSYPFYYPSGWLVNADPDGHLVDAVDGMEYYALYYEMNLPDFNADFDTGYVVEKSDYVRFLNDKCKTLGLNYKETNEFIIYWLSLMQEYDYVFVHFLTTADVNELMPLNIYTSDDGFPDTTIRVWMYWKGLDKPFEVDGQNLLPVERSGFTVVEWGGIDGNSGFDVK